MDWLDRWTGTSELHVRGRVWWDRWRRSMDRPRRSQSWSRTGERVPISLQAVRESRPQPLTVHTRSGRSRGSGYRWKLGSSYRRQGHEAREIPRTAVAWAGRS